MTSKFYHNVPGVIFSLNMRDLVHAVLQMLSPFVTKNDESNLALCCY